MPISDGVLSNITAGYADLIRRQKIAEGTVWGQRYDAAHEQGLHSRSEVTRAAARDHRETEYQAYMDEWHVTHPERIRAAYARVIARAGQAYYHSNSLDPEDAAEMLASTVKVSDEDLSISEVVFRYQLRMIRDYFQDPDVTTAERLEDVRVELRRMLN